MTLRPLPSAPARLRRLGPWMPADGVGPQWFPAAMGTGILATCTQELTALVPGLHATALAFLALAWAVLAAVGTGFAADAVREPGRLRATFGDLATLPFYGAMSMGLLSVGAATLVVGQPHLPQAASALAWTLWCAGTLLGIATAVVFPTRLIAAGPSGRGTPTPVWVLSVVPPMVASAGGALLAGALPPGPTTTALLAVCAALFALALVLGTVLLALVYGHLLRGGAVTPAAAPSYWIPVGIAGQSTAAANLVLEPASHVLSAPAYRVLRGVSAVYSDAALSLGAVAAVIALWLTVRALREGLGFNLGWWSFTFPIGTMSLGLASFGATLHSSWLQFAAAAVCLALAGTVTLCLVRSARLWVAGRA